MKKTISKAYYGSIFFEFVLQDRRADAVIILPDFPSRNNYDDIISLFYEKGYHVFVPRYRGSYESNGKFLSKNIVDDMVFFTKKLEQGTAKNLIDMKKYTFKINKKIIVAGSFSGAIACGLAAKYPVFSHLILMAPIWDFSAHNLQKDEEDINKLLKTVKRTYKNCYRINFEDIVLKMGKFKELNPEYYLPKLELPVLVMHDPNDKVVSIRHSKEKLALLKRGTYLEHYLGNGLTEGIIHPLWSDIDKFIKINYLG